MPLRRSHAHTSTDQFTAGFFLNAALSVGYKAHALQSTINTITAVFQVSVLSRELVHS